MEHRVDIGAFPGEIHLEHAHLGIEEDTLIAVGGALEVLFGFFQGLASFCESLAGMPKLGADIDELFVHTLEAGLEHKEQDNGKQQQGSNNQEGGQVHLYGKSGRKGFGCLGSRGGRNQGKSG